MRFKWFFVQCFSMLIICSLSARGQSYQENARLYIAKYKDLAIQEQVRTGVPAAIKLAQGIYETAAGKSELCAQARNHFGIKCKSGWTGLTYAYTDDAPNECFRSYHSDLESYTDHSEFLKVNPRYKSLFSIDRADYMAWAKELKKCGYATNPAYAEKLIQTIETFGLQQYTLEAEILRNGGRYLAYAAAEDSLDPRAALIERRPVIGEPVAADAWEPEATIRPENPTAAQQDSPGAPVIEYYVTTEKNGIKGFYAKKGDLLLEYALTHRVRYARLLEWNDLPDAPLEANMFIYLSKKRRSGLVPRYTVERGMTMHLISQELGVSLASLLLYNKLGPGEQPVPGAVLNLQGPVEQKPQIYTLSTAGRQPVERQQQGEQEYIYKKDIAEKNYTLQPQEVDVDLKEPAVSDAAKSLAAGPGEEGSYIVASLDAGSADAGPASPQELSRKEKRTQKNAEKSEEELTPLEKLKRHMDKNVYGNQDGDWREEAASTQNEAAARPEQITTFPARRVTESPRERTVGRGEAISRETHHTVRAGDTAFSIAKRYGISLQQLRTWNNLPASMVVQKGQRLKVAP